MIPAEFRFGKEVVLGPGLEPGTNRLKVYCSTN